MATNVLTLYGRLTADPELKKTGNGTSLCQFSIAHERAYSGKENEKKTDFFNATAWRNTAEYLVRNGYKGREVVLTAHLQMDVWKDKDTGKNRSGISIVVDSIQLCGAGKNNRSGSTNDGGDYSSYEEPPQQTFNGAESGFTMMEMDDSDLPF